ncbi:hypothetical protein BH23GEM5_BH23GEM5_02840 [soil metagenome]|jgi:cytochrome c-type biogenesis protein CcmH/NrfF|nr:cytochrome c-type biogenesis protein CcmH [Gemmatimonadota bacterium]
MSMVALLAFWLVVGVQDPAHGPPPSDAVAQSAIGELRSPYCPGLMLEVCPSPQAELLRDSIRDLAAAGQTKHEIVAWMIDRHGEEWRAVPRRSGVGLWAWIVPPLALLGAGAWLARRGWSLRRTAPPPVVPSEISSTDQARLDAELRELERIG